jgi:hypothetical protein
MENFPRRCRPFPKSLENRQAQAGREGLFTLNECSWLYQNALAAVMRRTLQQRPGAASSCANAYFWPNVAYDLP